MIQNFGNNGGRGLNAQTKHRHADTAMRCAELMNVVTTATDVSSLLDHVKRRHLDPLAQLLSDDKHVQVKKGTLPR